MHGNNVITLCAYIFASIKLQVLNGTYSTPQMNTHTAVAPKHRLIAITDTRANYPQTK